MIVTTNYKGTKKLKDVLINYIARNDIQLCSKNQESMIKYNQASLLGDVVKGGQDY